ncbi:2-hydroxyacyl-CoA dehydratase [Candidatus Desulfarcum epimagneticum]|uniref:2-hydroxyacyl-CoA dehydratase n=1 Tax=uncultured Desulfobacteraceae bacterium TaxID=218296 RepID=A0A484HK71_9BACT|nr:2-hydroxyacyl-CoA dehydratase [uncultured Desulfobacteraceae bacterium]
MSAMMKTLTPFYEISRDPSARAAAAKEDGRRIMGCFCSYAPVEIISAAGFVPFRIFGRGKRAEKADSHLQSYCCGHVRGALADALSGELDFLEGAVFPHTCDSIQRLSDIWRMNAKMGFHWDLALPADVSGKGARVYMKSVLERFRQGLEDHFGANIPDSEIRKAAASYNRIRRMLTRFLDIASENPARISGSDTHAVLRASMSADPGTIARLLEPLLAEAESAGEKDDGGAPKKRLILSGGPCDFPDIRAAVEEAGGVAAGDDTCSGGRSFPGEIDSNAEDIMAAVADAYLGRIVCPSKHSGLKDRGRRLAEMARKAKADGVVFLFLKFCDPHLFDYPYLKETLKERGVDSIMFEIDGDFVPDGQFKTRLEAFLETVGR